ncbi:Os11g0598200 [Oryza sativa Japonica Group]|uniref:Os11g0598200 protein n=2 Tax=Oryza sativa subsp. japonica TaxID=39947 RepID=C7J8R3_ORYSJ|nr:hypothetical protein EE612_056496 [Oryza sativa]KAB8115772.1 hypothetical protein EE612_056496 [Oryza sativa]BAH95365.1 Os11g0598150 [Oryza sativa Japonica Group]BAT14732.1 Os11g0598200 [Oryza sativa Japonica Group]|eukprot:NP_001176637.1 Os11g0598150 [Oryza sativa Japonica Group]
MQVEDKTIFSSSQAASSSKVILVKFEPSIRRYLRHLKSSFLKLSTLSVHEMCRSLTHCNMGSWAKNFRSSWFSGVLLRVTLASFLLPPLVNNGKRCLAPLMLRLSRNSGWSFRRDAISCNSGLEGVTSSVVVGIVIDRERRLACRSLIALSKLPR